MRLTISEDKNKTKKTNKKGKEDSEEVPPYAKSPKAFVFELIKIVLIALAIIIPIRYFLFQPFYVRGASMEPNFYDSEYLIVDEITYRFSDPQRGDVVVVTNPQKISEFFIKRIVGLPGETVEIKDDKVFIINKEYPDGKELDEDYLGEGVVTAGFKKVSLSAEEFYMLGDNRSVSRDSRFFGPLTSDHIVGRAWLRVWPFSEWSHFVAPEFQL